ncbi:MAG: 1-acyl-sn-glycerol-3-phosphate acyltransferase [Saprospiraceae bacterium]|nr:1-acyl-sn-glycerol-3-phosphate acyltransferase [Saprospiraceae bacterium]
MKLFAQFVLRLLGWNLIGHEKLVNYKKYILIVGPHTSNWDFPLGILIRKAAGLDYVKFIGKDSLFKPPIGWLFKSLGGYPVDRSKHNNQVQSLIELFNQNEKFAIVMSPEGTRKKVERFKTGFYYIAKGAKIPIIPCIFDYSLRECRYLDPIYCSENSELDILKIENIFKGIQGKNPKYNFD